MPNPPLEEVNVFQWKRNQSTGEFEKIPDGTAEFRAWGQLSFLRHDKGYSVPAAIIQRDDGHVETLPARLIQFT